MTWQDCLDELAADHGKSWLAEHIGVHEAVVRSWVSRRSKPNANNIDKIRLLYRHPERDDQLREELADAVARGWSLADIAEEYEVTEEKAALWLRMYDL